MLSAALVTEVKEDLDIQAYEENMGAFRTWIKSFGKGSPQ